MSLPANFAYWDSIEEFELTEACWLWCGLEPPTRTRCQSVLAQELNGVPHGKLPAMGQRVLEAIQTADIDLQFPGYYFDQWERFHIFPRADLRTWAKNYSSFRPRFLFPPTPARTDLTLDTALKLIVILAKAADPRWNPGQAIPHGMATKLVKIADSLGLQLHRNTIGNYLREAGNKNISAL